MCHKMDVRFICLSVCLACVFDKISPQPTYTVKNGDQVNHCFLCPIGTMVSEHCQEDLTQSTCQPCPEHEYMDTPNSEKHCKGCNTSCPKNGKVHQNCTRTTNFLCLCEHGFHRHPFDPIDYHYKCKAHTRCLDGYGVKTYGNHSHDTTCEQCVEGLEFVDTSDPDIPLCQTCSECPAGSDVIANCSLANDTLCSDTESAIISTVRPEKESDGNSGGEIEAIVIVILFVVVVIIAVLVVIWMKRTGRPPCLKSTNSKKDEENPNEGDEMLPQEPPTAEPSNQEPSNEEPAVPEPSDSNSSIAWSPTFIKRHIFSYLSNHIGEKWKTFILTLPGWPEDVNVQTIIDHKESEERFVRDRILGCLMEWANKAEKDSVTKDNIVRALEELELNEVVAHLHKKAREYSSTSEPNGV